MTKIHMSPRPFPCLMDYDGICLALYDEWQKLDPIDTSRPIIADAGRAIETLCDEVKERETLIGRLYASLAELTLGVQEHGAEKWMPHRVERAVQILNELRPHDEN